MQPDIITHPAPVRWGLLSVANIGVKRVIPAILASSNGRLMAVASGNLHRARALRLAATIENLATIEAIYQSASYPWPIGL